MNYIRILCILPLAVFTFSVPAAAEVLTVTPDHWNYGNVAVGNSDSIIFQGLSDDFASPLIITNIYLTPIGSDPIDAFTITSTPTFPQVLLPGEFVNVELTFDQQLLAFSTRY